MKIIRLSFTAICALSLMRSALADETVPSQTVGSTQSLTVQNPGTVTTATPGPVLIEGKAVFVGGAGVVLKPGFRAKENSLFRASRDLNLAGFSSLADSDFDSLPDAWEMLHFNNLTSATGIGDNDGDGFSNAIEYLAGTSPTFNDATATSGSFQVVLRTPSGKYRGVASDWSINPAP
jgi:hypothetical protein